MDSSCHHQNQHSKCHLPRATLEFSRQQPTSLEIGAQPGSASSQLLGSQPSRMIKHTHTCCKQTSLRGHQKEHHCAARLTVHESPGFPLGRGRAVEGPPGSKRCCQLEKQPAAGPDIKHCSPQVARQCAVFFVFLKSRRSLASDLCGLRQGQIMPTRADDLL